MADDIVSQMIRITPDYLLASSRERSNFVVGLQARDTIRTILKS